MANLIDELTRYRLKVEKDGKSIVNVPGVLALPGLLTMPRLSIAGLVAAPLLGCKVRLESEDGKAVDVEETVRRAAETVADTANRAAATVREEIEKAWEAMSADDPEDKAEDESRGGGEAACEETKPEEASEPSVEELSNDPIVEDLKKHEAEDVPTIHVEKDSSEEA